MSQLIQQPNANPNAKPKPHAAGSSGSGPTLDSADDRLGAAPDASHVALSERTTHHWQSHAYAGMQCRPGPVFSSLPIIAERRRNDKSKDVEMQSRVDVAEVPAAQRCRPMQCPLAPPASSPASCLIGFITSTVSSAGTEDRARAGDSGPVGPPFPHAPMTPRRGSPPMMAWANCIVARHGPSDPVSRTRSLCRALGGHRRQLGPPLCQRGNLEPCPCASVMRRECGLLGPGTIWC